MRKNVFLYLFVFAALIALFLLMKGNKMQETNNLKIEKLKTELTLFKDSLQQTQFRLMDMQYFSLENNDDALAYYDHLNLKKPARYIEDKLLETNEQKGDNPLVPYDGMNGAFKINKIKVLNHRWLLADFSNGKYWGDLVIKYELKDDLSIDFTVMDYLLYARSD